MSKPEYVKVDDKIYKINTDFRVALECNEIAKDKTIGELERALAIIYKLFGEEGLNCENQNKLMELGMKYISLGREQKRLKNDSGNKYELDFNKCKDLISSSFKFDYKYDPYEMEYLHWYTFYNDLENLSTSEFGTCCALNRIMSIINNDGKMITDSKEKQKFLELKEELINKYCIVKEKELTEKQKESQKELYKSLGIEI